jgi:hypothetical protein
LACISWLALDHRWIEDLLSCDWRVLRPRIGRTASTSDADRIDTVSAEPERPEQTSGDNRRFDFAVSRAVSHLHDIAVANRAVEL